MLRPCPPLDNSHLDIMNPTKVANNAQRMSSVVSKIYVCSIGDGTGKTGGYGGNWALYEYGNNTSNVWPSTALLWNTLTIPYTYQTGINYEKNKTQSTA